MNEILLNLIKNREDDSDDDSENERVNEKPELKKAPSKVIEEPKSNFYIHDAIYILSVKEGRLKNKIKFLSKMIKMNKTLRYILYMFN